MLTTPGIILSSALSPSLSQRRKCVEDTPTTGSVLNRCRLLLWCDINLFASGHRLQTCKIRFSETFRCAMKLRSNMPYWLPYSNWGVGLFHILLWSIASLYISLARVFAFEFNIDPLFTYTDLNIRHEVLRVCFNWFVLHQFKREKMIFHSPLKLKIIINL